MALEFIKKNSLLIGIYQTILASQEKFMAEQIKIIYFDHYQKPLPSFLQDNSIYLDFHDYLVTGITKEILLEPRLICPSCWKAGTFRLRQKKQKKDKILYFLSCKVCQYQYYFNFLNNMTNDFITFVLSNLDSLIQVQEFKDVINKYYLSRLEKDTKGII